MCSKTFSKHFISHGQLKALTVPVIKMIVYSGGIGRVEVMVGLKVAHKM